MFYRNFFEESSLPKQQRMSVSSTSSMSSSTQPSSVAEEELMIKVLVIGCSGIGKSHFIYRLSHLLRKQQQYTNSSGASTSSTADSSSAVSSPKTSNIPMASSPSGDHASTASIFENNIPTTVLSSSSGSSVSKMLNTTVGFHLTTVRLRKRAVQQYAYADPALHKLVVDFGKPRTAFAHHNYNVLDSQMYETIPSITCPTSKVESTGRDSVFAKIGRSTGIISRNSSPPIPSGGFNVDNGEVVYPNCALQFWELPDKELSGFHLKEAFDGVSGVFVMINSADSESLTVVDEWQSQYQEYFRSNHAEMMMPPMYLLAPRYVRGSAKPLIPSGQLEKYVASSPIFRYYTKIDMDNDKALLQVIGIAMPELLRYNLRWRQRPNSIGNEDFKNELPVNLKAPSELIWSWRYCNETSIPRDLAALKSSLNEALSDSIQITDSDKRAFLQEFDQDCAAAHFAENPVILSILKSKFDRWQNMVKVLAAEEYSDV